MKLKIASGIVTVKLLEVLEYTWRTWKEIGWTGDQNKSREYPDQNIAKISSTISKSAGDLRWHAVNQASLKTIR